MANQFEGTQFNYNTGAQSSLPNSISEDCLLMMMEYQKSKKSLNIITVTSLIGCGFFKTKEGLKFAKINGKFYLGKIERDEDDASFFSGLGSACAPEVYRIHFSFRVQFDPLLKEIINMEIDDITSPDAEKHVKPTDSIYFRGYPTARMVRFDKYGHADNRMPDDLLADGDMFVGTPNNYKWDVPDEEKKYYQVYNFGDPVNVPDVSIPTNLIVEFVRLKQSINSNNQVLESFQRKAFQQGISLNRVIIAEFIKRFQ